MPPLKVAEAVEDEWADSVPPWVDVNQVIHEMEMKELEPPSFSSSFSSGDCKIRKSVQPYVFEIYAPYVNNEAGTYDFNGHMYSWPCDLTHPELMHLLIHSLK